MVKNNHILYLIDSLGLGGAETIVVNTLNYLSFKYTYLKISLFTTVEANGILAKKLDKNINYTHINCVGINFIKGVFIIKRYMEKNNVTHLHTHLYHSIMVGRFSIKSKINLIETYHNLEYNPASVYYSHWRVVFDKLTFKKNARSIYVSEDVKLSITKSRPLNHYNLVLNNFAGVEFKYHYVLKKEPNLKLIAIGNLKNDKNFIYALKTLVQLKTFEITLDIYGDGFLRQELEEFIFKNKLSVRLMGRVAITMEIFSNYDAFLMTSKNEGMPISLLESINFGMPSILPYHLPVMKQVAQNAALYYSINNESSLKNLLVKLFNDKKVLLTMSLETKKQSALFSIDNHINLLARVYNVN